jgi:DNA (cytosine-5)-methyltransferase 1
MTPTVKSYFSGCGGMDLGLADAGLDVVESFEIDRTCCDQLGQLGHKVTQCDITGITVLDQQDADVYVGTFPCQRYSLAGEIHGVRTGDDLFLHFFRHVALARPEVYVVENVPGMRKFRVVMEALTKLPDYYVRVECPVDATAWVPQRRRRLILIGSKRPMRIEEPERRSVSVASILEHDPDVRTPGYVARRMQGAYRDLPHVTKRDGVAPCCVAHYGKDRSTSLVDDGKRIRPWSVREYARLQGFPDWYRFDCSDSKAYTMIGNAVPVPMARWVGEQVMSYFNGRRAA